MTATFDPAHYDTTALTLSNGNLTAAATSGSFTEWGTARGTNGSAAGKFYSEFTVAAINTTEFVGVYSATDNVAGLFPGQSGTQGVGLEGNGSYFEAGTGTSLGVSYGNGSVVGMAVDVSNGLIWWRVGSGSWNGSGTANPATGVGGISFSITGLVYPAAATFGGDFGNSFTANFGGSAYVNIPPSGFSNWTTTVFPNTLLAGSATGIASSSATSAATGTAPIGSLLVAILDTINVGASITGFTDSVGNAYVIDGITGGTSYGGAAIAYCLQSTVAITTSTTWTATTSSGNWVPCGFFSVSGYGQRNNFFGVNITGAEYATPVFARQLQIGLISHSVGVTIVRLPVAWENLTTTLGGSLQTTYLNNIKTALSNANAVGIGVIVDLHNFGAYAAAAQWGSTVTYAGSAGTPGTGVSFLGNGITGANFADVWTKLSTALTGLPGLIGYGLMNEPSENIVNTNLISPPNYFASILTSNWFVINGCVVTELAAGTNPLGSTYGPAWSITSGTGFGGLEIQPTLANVAYTLSCYARVTSGTDANFGLAIGSTNNTHTATTSWQRFSVTGTPTAGTVTLLILLNEASGHTVDIANVQLELGSSASTYQPNQYMPYAQTAITAIRAVDTVTPIYICGGPQSGGFNWQAFNYEFNQFTGGNLVFEVHQYFDGPEGEGGGGNYSGTFTSYSIDTNSGTQALTPYLSWLSAFGFNGFVGEFAIPNSTADNNAQWFVLLQNVLRQLIAANVKGTFWQYCPTGSGGSGTNISLVNPGAGAEDPRLVLMLNQTEGINSFGTSTGATSASISTGALTSSNVIAFAQARMNPQGAGGGTINGTADGFTPLFNVNFVDVSFLVQSGSSASITYAPTWTTNSPYTIQIIAFDGITIPPAALNPATLIFM